MIVREDLKSHGAPVLWKVILDERQILTVL